MVEGLALTACLVPVVRRNVVSEFGSMPLTRGGGFLSSVCRGLLDGGGAKLCFVAVLLEGGLEEEGCAGGLCETTGGTRAGT